MPAWLDVLPEFIGGQRPFRRVTKMFTEIALYDEQKPGARRKEKGLQTCDL